ncbi:TIM-barrel domain-containing protein [Silvibacterium dinghuense]|uniref:Glycoside hydrolase family 31 protein n=2 Tax=Silvibacterium dinghuense TaxID=1560006 RepID=A0A4Q1SKA1_9BACT|nr:TIM-barrel domain-containing protein [Silvibacterium dinghuense]RXS98106.1 glycoside hydrolase family 31 protein [Silvibacterium dinghuense]
MRLFFSEGQPSRQVLLLLLAFMCLSGSSVAQTAVPPADQEGNIIIEPYAPNIVHVLIRVPGTGEAPSTGYGLIGKPSRIGWSEQEVQGGKMYQSGRMTVHVVRDQNGDRSPKGIPLDKLNMSLRDIFFPPGKRGPVDPRFVNHDDSIVITREGGKPLLTMRRWQIEPNNTDAAAIANAAAKNIPKPELYHISVLFDSPDDEHYYGLGQHQGGFLDLRDHRIDCWHDYGKPGGEEVCVPFMISSRGYGLVWDNPSKTHISLGINNVNSWSSDVADQISFFVISGKTTDDIYAGFRQISGITHLLPKGAYGYVQSKAIYATQDQLLDVAKGYRDRHLPADVLVVDFLNMTRQGEMDLDPKRWPNPGAMNDQLHSMGFTTMLSVWPHYSEGTQFYDMLKAKGWLISRPDGTPDRGNYSQAVGPNIDSTNPEAARWFWNKIRDRYIKPDHFDYIWLDETEPDVDPANDLFHIGTGPRFYDVYPLLHTAAIYDGFRHDYGDSRRVFSLARASYLGAQSNGTLFWSSDIVASWDMLKRSVPAGLNFTASGMPYWSTDIAGFFSPSFPPDYTPAKTPLIDPTPARDNIGRYSDYPELFTRWFEWGTFQPVLRAHGEREHNEVWSYGPQAEAILSKYLRLRYALLPYTYACAYRTYQNGAPYMRALFMDFGGDPLVRDITDEYMYGPAFLVAPVLEQGQTVRPVYLPAGTDWYDYWTHKRYVGGQTIMVNAPIDTLPLFVRAGSIVPLGSEILSTQQKQTVTKLLVFPGADTSFTLYDDDGTTYGYEKGKSQITELVWNDKTRQLTKDGKSVGAGSAMNIEVVEPI